MRGPKPGRVGHLITTLVACGFAAAVFIAFLGIGGGLPAGGSAHELKAIVPTSASLTTSSRVTMSGVEVGRIAAVERHGFNTLVTMEIDEDRVWPVPADSTVTLRQRTPVGESYVAITPGRARTTMADGGVLPASQATEYVDVDQILSVLRGKTRDRARQLIQGMGSGLDGRGEKLNDLIDGGASTLEAGAKVFSLLSKDREQVARLVDRLGRVSAAVGERGATVELVARRGLTTMRALSSRDAALRGTLRQLPSTLRQVRSTSTRLASITNTSGPVLEDVAGALRDLRPAVARLRPAAQVGREVVRELDVTARPLETTLAGVRRLSGPLTKALPELRQTLCEANPVIRYLKPYTDDAIMSIVGLGSASNSYDAVGHLIRLTPIVGENSLAGAPPEVSTAAHALLRTGIVSESVGLSWNPYPADHMIGKDQAGPSKTIHGPDALRESGYKYPRVMADC